MHREVERPLNGGRLSQGYPVATGEGEDDRAAFGIQVRTQPYTGFALCWTLSFYGSRTMNPSTLCSRLLMPVPAMILPSGLTQLALPRVHVS